MSAGSTSKAFASAMTVAYDGRAREFSRREIVFCGTLLTADSLACVNLFRSRNGRKYIAFMAAIQSHYPYSSQEGTEILNIFEILLW